MIRNCTTCRYLGISPGKVPCIVCDGVKYWQPEFPATNEPTGENEPTSPDTTTEPSLRDRFAMAAVTALLREVKALPEDDYENLAQRTAGAAYLVADAMLKKRKDVPHVSGGEP